ncbi:MAG: DUF3098 domain-containing protein [Bacteroidia bacterium]|nr:DUF3098 domain-containing protein [Bacteroidia bacterium]
MSEKNSNAKKTTEKVSQAPTGDFIFGKDNYILMLAGVLVIILGFTLMAGKEKILEDTTKITVAPVVILLGFVIEIYAIMKPNKG